MQCWNCGEEFDSHFRFCPVDGRLLRRAPVGEYHLTFVSETPLLPRLISEARYLLVRFHQAWPQFKAEPLRFTKLQVRQLRSAATRIIARPHSAAASLTAIAIVLAVVVGTVFLENRRGKTASNGEFENELIPTATIEFEHTAEGSKPGIGAGQNGRVGFNKGRGEGSADKPARARGGGGGGGDLSKLSPSQGRLPVPSFIPAPIPTTYARQPRALPEAGINIDPVLWRDLPFRDYGDPRSKSIVPSNGPGKGGGVGTGEGTGIGEGLESGFGPGKKGNMGGGENTPGGGGKGGSPGNGLDMDRVFGVTEVSTRARVLSKPEPQYTEEARRGGVTGTVVLNVIFSRAGQVTNIKAVQSLCCGLTEKAIAAARQIRFIAATRDGQPVSTRMQLEYNFNLY